MAIKKERLETKLGRRGFTLIEILIVVAIIAILASVVLVGLGPTQRQGRDARRISDLQQIQNGLELYFNHCGWYPGGANCSAWSTTNGGSNAAFVSMGTALTGTSAIGVPTVPNDPTNVAPYQYEYASASANSYTLAATLEDANNAALRNSIHSSNSNGVDCSASSTYCISL